MPDAGRRWPFRPDHPHALAALVAAFTLLRLVLAATAPLLPQEAYYWHWSRHLDWSYFDHPPLATYAIALTTAVFGQTAFGIKLAAVLWSLGWNLLWVRLILDLYGDRRLAFWSLLALNLTVAYEAYGVGPTPDGPLLFGWVGTVWAVWHAVQAGSGWRWWLAAGAFAGLALLGKYAAVLLAPVVLLFLALSPAQRHWLRRPQPYVAMVLALIMFLPVVYWNAMHGWASFAFQGSRRAGQMTSFHPHHLLTLVGTQLLLVTPYLFALALAALLRGVRGGLRRADDRTRLLLASGAVPLLVFGAVALRSLVKLNWLLPAYWSLIVLGTAWALRSRESLRRFKFGLASSAVVVAAGMVITVVPDLPLAGDLNSWSGWPEAAARVERVARAERAGGREVFVFSPNYKISSLLRFHLPGQPRTYAQDIFGAPALQFDHFPLGSDLKGASGILVLSNQDNSALDLERLKPYFASVERVDGIETRGLGQVTRRIKIFLCRDYHGHPRRLPAPQPPRRHDEDAPH